MKWNNLWLLILLLGSTYWAQEATLDKAKGVIDTWHQAAAKGDFDTYFGLMTAPGVFVGTDASEHWTLDHFKKFSKPYFDKGKAWAFTSVERHIYLDDSGDTAYFDELLDTHMGICRGSGVLQLKNGKWKIAHYVLSIAVPNEDVSALLEIKKEKDSLLLAKLKGS